MQRAVLAGAQSCSERGKAASSPLCAIQELTISRVWMSQTTTLWSSEPATRYRPSAVTTAGMQYLCEAHSGKRSVSQSVFEHRNQLRAVANDSLAVDVTRVGFDHLVRLIVPQPDGRVECRGEEELRVGREADRGDGRVIFVDERLEALSGRGVPDAAVSASGQQSESDEASWTHK